MMYDEMVYQKHKTGHSQTAQSEERKHKRLVQGNVGVRSEVHVGIEGVS